MAQTSPQFYPYATTPSVYFDAAGQFPVGSVKKYWDANTAATFQPIQTGLNTATGKRDTELASQNLANSWTGLGYNNQEQAGDLSYGVAEDVNADLYDKLINKLEPKVFQSSLKQQALGLGSGLAFTAASYPFVTALRREDLRNSLLADIQSPTRQAERIAKMSEMLGTQKANSLNSQANYLNALANVRQGAVANIGAGVVRG
jgi:hypothetical protein